MAAAPMTRKATAGGEAAYGEAMYARVRGPDKGRARRTDTAPPRDADPDELDLEAFAALEPAPLREPETSRIRRSSATGLPDSLRSGLESLSGLELDDVRVHRRSARPAALGAAACTEGADIHLGPGQEEHLPHEAWHVVQQKQGRVRPTARLGGTDIAETGSLEAEADAMGARASACPGPSTAPRRRVTATPGTVQLKWGSYDGKDRGVVRGILERVGRLHPLPEEARRHPRGAPPPRGRHRGGARDRDPPPRGPPHRAGPRQGPGGGARQGSERPVHPSRGRGRAGRRGPRAVARPHGRGGQDRRRPAVAGGQPRRLPAPRPGSHRPGRPRRSNTRTRPAHHGRPRRCGDRPPARRRDRGRRPARGRRRARRPRRPRRRSHRRPGARRGPGFRHPRPPGPQGTPRGAGPPHLRRAAHQRRRARPAGCGGGRGRRANPVARLRLPRGLLGPRRQAGIRARGQGRRAGEGRVVQAGRGRPHGRPRGHAGGCQGGAEPKAAQAPRGQQDVARPQNGARASHPEAGRARRTGRRGDRRPRAGAALHRHHGDGPGGPERARPGVRRLVRLRGPPPPRARRAQGGRRGPQAGRVDPRRDRHGPARRSRAPRGAADRPPALPPRHRASRRPRRSGGRRPHGQAGGSVRDQPEPRGAAGRARHGTGAGGPHRGAHRRPRAVPQRDRRSRRARGPRRPPGTGGSRPPADAASGAPQVGQGQARRPRPAAPEGGCPHRAGDRPQVLRHGRLDR